jgi:hypothetical protein
MNASNLDCLMTHTVLFRRGAVVRDTFAAVRSQVVIGHLTVVRSSHDSYIASDVWRQPGCRRRAGDAHSRLTVAVCSVSEKPGAGAGKDTICGRQSNHTRMVFMAVDRKPMWVIRRILSLM